MTRLLDIKILKLVILIKSYSVLYEVTITFCTKGLLYAIVGHTTKPQNTPLDDDRVEYSVVIPQLKVSNDPVNDYNEKDDQLYELQSKFCNASYIHLDNKKQDTNTPVS